MGKTLIGRITGNAKFSTATHAQSRSLRSDRALRVSAFVMTRLPDASEPPAFETHDFSPAANTAKSDGFNPCAEDQFDCARQSAPESHPRSDTPARTAHSKRILHGRLDRPDTPGRPTGPTRTHQRQLGGSDSETFTGWSLQGQSYRAAVCVLSGP